MNLVYEFFTLNLSFSIIEINPSSPTNGAISFVLLNVGVTPTTELNIIRKRGMSIIMSVP